MKKNILIPILLAFIFFGCKTNEDKSTKDLVNAPVAKKIPKELTLHDDTRIDNYFWMRLSDDQRMLKILIAKRKMFLII